MQYLFFDIECANCDNGNGKICSFGYTLTDQNFKVLESDDIIINPNAPFRLTGWGNKSYIKLAYSKEVFLSAPLFPHFYDRIKKLIQGEDKLIFGFAPENDTSFLRAEFERYDLPCVNFTFYDVQRIYKYFSRSECSNLSSLQSVCEDFQVSLPSDIHRSLDDAFATMEILKNICASDNLTPVQLVQKYTPSKGILREYELEISYFKKTAEQKEGEENFINRKNEVEFKKYLRRLKRDVSVPKNPALKGKIVCFSFPYEYKNYAQIKKLVKHIVDSGAYYTRKSKICTLYVLSPDDYKSKKCIREKHVDERISGGKNLQKIEFKDFLSLLNLTREELDNEVLPAAAGES